MRARTPSSFLAAAAIVVTGLVPTAARAEVAGAVDATTATAAARLASGGLGTCAIDPSGGVQCWGENHDGQLLAGDEEDRGNDAGEGPYPVFLGRGVKAQSVSYASSHACAVAEGGVVFCWGRDLYGQLGDDSRGNSIGDAPGERAVRVPIAAASQVAVGKEHSCALLVDGSVSCWGGNVVGQLGRGSADDDGDAPGPVDLGGAKATAISTRASTTCVILTSSELRCWGANESGQAGVLPTSTAIGDQPGEKPAKPNVVGTVKAIAMGGQFACAIDTADAVRCWGRGNEGQLLSGNQNSSGTPAPTLSMGGTVKAIAAGSQTACAIRTSGRLVCWGSNADGMLGVGLLPGGGNWGDSPGETAPKVVDLPESLNAASAVSIGIFHSCALLASSGTPLCWGASGAGQWGTGQTGGGSVPATARTAVAWSAGLPDADGDGLPDRFDACPQASSTADDGCPLPTPTPTPAPKVATASPTPSPLPVVPPVKKAVSPVTLKADQVTYDVLLEPKKTSQKTCPAKAELKITGSKKAATTKTVKLKAAKQGKTLRCSAKGTLKLKAVPDGGALVQARFAAKGLKTRTVVAERIG